MQIHKILHSVKKIDQIRDDLTALLRFALFLYDPDLTTRAKKPATPLFYSNKPKRIYNKSRSIFALNHIESGNFAF